MSALSRSLHWLGGAGRCIQGNDGAHTHVKELRYAYDFALAEGTAVLAARDGEVAVAVDCFHEGGLRKELKARANYVAVRHDEGSYSRYFHLQ
eukprot:CAMPEP_0119387400 /NCGR_PEP_ID=MMETSP1334-20130426/100513_1 /TAXON_ID=127549 /ORGANISM="Calcidiscus leptoporus, Strain RCC1130" /LENGTH=92 /DNA_ID=CAMNT_0007409129 /DNA_START=1 /DNA_END=276 /DNA_ORIENTATION=-